MKVKVWATQSCPTLCGSQGLQPARPLCPWNSPGKNTGVGSHSLLQGIFPTQGSNPGLLYCRQILYCLSHQGSFISHISILCILKLKVSILFKFLNSYTLEIWESLIILESKSVKFVWKPTSSLWTSGRTSILSYSSPSISHCASWFLLLCFLSFWIWHLYSYRFESALGNVTLVCLLNWLGAPGPGLAHFGNTISSHPQKTQGPVQTAWPERYRFFDSILHPQRLGFYIHHHPIYYSLNYFLDHQLS